MNDEHDYDLDWCPARWPRHACIFGREHEGEHRCSCGAQLAPV